ncbi:hypothetical protein BTA51_13865 [Hahella sp. CCB-MM4]|nr:hypothetical protein BTA51_13865 [Hahella sp. CCB-MM4]
MRPKSICLSVWYAIYNRHMDIHTMMLFVWLMGIMQILLMHVIAVSMAYLCKMLIFSHILELKVWQIGCIIIRGREMFPMKWHL